MKSVSKSIGMLTLGLVIGSLPYTLSLGKANAQQDLSRLKPKHTPVRPEHVVIDGRSMYLIYSGHVTKIDTNGIPYDSWQKLPDIPHD